MLKKHEGTIVMLILMNVKSTMIVEIYFNVLANSGKNRKILNGTFFFLFSGYNARTALHQLRGSLKYDALHIGLNKDVMMEI